jgi:hypothetical protein
MFVCNVKQNTHLYVDETDVRSVLLSQAGPGEPAESYTLNPSKQCPKQEPTFIAKHMKTWLKNCERRWRMWVC